MTRNLSAGAETFLEWGQEAMMHHKHTDEPAWLSDKDKQSWNGERDSASEIPGLIPKPFESLPETPRSAPAVTNSLPDDL